MRSLLVIVAFLTFCITTHIRAAEPAPDLWLYCPTNLLVDKNIDKLHDLWSRAAKAGYTHVLLAESKFSRLNAMDKRYFDNCERVKTIAKELNLSESTFVLPP